MADVDLISRKEVNKYLTILLSDYLYEEERKILEKFRAWLWELPTYSAEQTDLITALSKLPTAESSDGQDYVQMYDVLETVKAYQTDSLIQDTKSKLFEFAETYEWCNGCKEYDTEKHCCHRYMNFIRYSLQDSINAVLEDIKEEIELAKWCDKETRLVKNCNASGLEVALDIINKHITKLKGDTE